VFAAMSQYRFAMPGLMVQVRISSLEKSLKTSATFEQVVKMCRLAGKTSMAMAILSSIIALEGDNPHAIVTNSR